MSSMLETALTILAYTACSTLTVLTIFLFTRMYGTPDAKVKVELSGKTESKVTNKAEDNIYTELAANKHVDAAKANRDAAAMNLETAQVNERTEQLRLERAQMEHSHMG